MKNNIKKIIFNIIILFICSINSIILFNKISRFNDYRNIYLLPLFFGLTYFWGSGKYIFTNKTIGIKMICLVQMLRYIILPNMMVYSSYYSGYGINPLGESIDIAIMLMIYEIIVISLVINILGKRIFGKLGNDKLDTEGIKRHNQLKTKEFASSIVIVIVVAVTVLFLMLKPGAIADINFVVIRENVKVDTDFLTTITRMLFISSKNLLFIVLIIKLARKFRRTTRKRYIYLSYIITLINMCIYLNDNRANILIFGVASLLTLMVSFPEYRKKTIVFCLISVGVLLVTMTVYKNFMNVLPETSQSLENIKFTKTLQAYVGGPRSVAQAIEMKKYYISEINLKMFLSDTFRSFLGLSKFVEKFSHLSTVKTFNMYIYGVSNIIDQIIPMIGQGYAYTNFIFAPIFSIIFTILTILYDSKLMRCTKLADVYIYTLVTTVVGLWGIYNINIEVQLLTITILPTAIILYIAKKLKIEH